MATGTLALALGPFDVRLGRDGRRRRSCRSRKTVSEEALGMRARPTRRRWGLVVWTLALASVAWRGAWAASPEENYHRLCRSCHGDDGSGNGPAAKVLSKHPGNFTDCEAMKAHDRGFLVKIIAEGGPAVGRSSQMPGSAKKLSAKEIEELADLVAKGFCKR
jgi:mono/diheme cytochrome c family protein